MTLPLFPPDLFEADREALLKIVHEVAVSPDQKFILGSRTAELEQALREHTGAADVIACGSGTGGLVLSVHALGIGPGDEVIVPAFCFPPVASSVANAGASPVFADVDPATMALDPADAERRITPRTRAIMPAHVLSSMADMPAFMDLGRRSGLPVVEDAAVAQGAVLGGTPAGRWGDLAVFSFFQIKAFGTVGEGGVVLTDQKDLGRRVRMLRNHGQDGVHRFRHHIVGHNSRFDEVLAAFQLHRLPSFAERLERRARIADYYTERFAPLADHGVLAPPPGRDGRCYHVYTLLVQRREALREYLAERAIGTHVYYPVPLPRQPAFAPWVPEGGGDNEWPHARQVSDRNLAIPIWPHLSDAQVEYIADAVCDFFE
jgi:dTDP-4-amino-4,6-dideoxygalactose transaminase